METMIYLRSNYRKGFVGFTTGDVQKRASFPLSIRVELIFCAVSTMPDTRNTAIYRDFVYDMTSYIQNGGGQPGAPAGTTPPQVSATDRAFMDPAVATIFSSNGGADVTSLIDGLSLPPDQLSAQRTCLRNLFLVGRVDTRNSAQCQFSRYILLAMSILIVCIIGFKCVASCSTGWKHRRTRAQIPGRAQLRSLSSARGIRARGDIRLPYRVPSYTRTARRASL